MNRYPLSWPDGWRRTESYRRRRAQFKHYGASLSVMQGAERVLLELQRLGVREGDCIISSNLPTRLDGLPRSDGPAPADPGVAVYWVTKNGPRRVMAIDVYDRVADNLAAVAATLEAMRSIERHGGAVVLERAFTGFNALPAPGKTARTWRDVMGFEPDARVTIDGARARYRSLAAARHPDRGGSTEAMSELNVAWAEAQRQLGVPA